MDLGLEGRIALVCGSSAGLGRACAEALLAAGAVVTLNGRDAKRLRDAASEISDAVGRTVPFVVADVTSAEGRLTLQEACPAVDILVTNSAGPPMGQFNDWNEADWHAAVDASMVTPIMLIKAYLGPMRARQWGRIVNITSSAVKAPLPLLGLSNGARSGLTGFVAGLAREVAADGVTINNLLPGRFGTDRLQSFVTRLASNEGIGVEEAAQRMAAANPMKRFGHPSEFGAFCAFLASEQAAYMTGQNILLDGGEYPGL